MFKTHLLISILLALLTLKFFPINPIIFFLIVCVAGSFPDIDLPKSTIGNMTRPFSDIINLLFGHRTITHSIFLPAIIFGIFTYFNLIPYGLAFLIGYIGHILADALSHEGINLLHPFPGFRLKGFVRVGGFFEYIIFLILLGLVIYGFSRMI